MSANALTLASAGTSLAKHVTVIDGVIVRVDDPPWPRVLSFTTIDVDTPSDLLEALRSAAGEDPAPCVVRAHPLSDMGRRALYADAELGPAGMRIEPRAWVGYDIEKVPATGIDPLHEPELAVERVRRCLPPAHHNTSVVWQLTASAGKRPDELRLRLWFLLGRPMLGRQLEHWCRPGINAGWLDPVTLRNEVIPHFIAVKIVGPGPDPCLRRWGMIRGDRDRVTVPDYALALSGRNDGMDLDVAGNIAALRAKLGPRFDSCRMSGLIKIRSEVEAVRAAGHGARHPTYMRAAARIQALCEFWAFPLDQARAKLEEAYLSTLTPDEARKRERCSTNGCWAWLSRRSGV